MQRLNSDYIARTKEIGRDFYSKLVESRTMAGETQDFYQGLLAGFDEFLKMDRALSESELQPTLELLEAKLATKIDTASQIDSSGIPALDSRSPVPYIGRLSPSYIDQLSSRAEKTNFGELVDSTVKDGETQDFYQGAIAAIDFAKGMSNHPLGFAVVGFMKINVSSHIQLEREPSKLSIAGDDLLANYRQEIASYSVDPVKSGFIRYQSPQGVGIIASFDDWDKVSIEGVDSSVYSYVDGMSKGEPTRYQDLSMACTDFVKRLGQLGGTVDDIGFFTSLGQRKKLRSLLLAAGEQVQEDEADVVSREVIRHEVQNLEEMVFQYRVGNVSDSLDEEFNDFPVEERQEVMEEEEENLSPEASIFVEEMEEWLVDKLLSQSGGSDRYQFQVVKDWTVFQEDGSYIRVVANSDNHLVLRASPDGELVSGLSYSDATRLFSALDEDIEEAFDEEVEFDEVEYFDDDDTDFDKSDVSGQSAQSALNLVDAEQLAMANRILPLIAALRHTLSEDEETEYPVGNEYELVLHQGDRSIGASLSLFATDGRGELLQIKGDRVTSVKNLTQDDLDIWEMIGERLNLLKRDEREREFDFEEFSQEEPPSKRGRTQKEDNGMQL